MNEQAIPQRVDAVVIGSGALGASTAFHLASSGLSVALLDKADLASQTSPRAAGLSGQLRSNPDNDVHRREGRAEDYDISG